VYAVRERAEEEAKQRLAALMAERDACAERRAEADRRLASAREAQRRIAARGGISVAEMLAHQAYVERAERLDRAAEFDLSRRDAEVEWQRAAVHAAMRERRILERLREKAERAHRARVQRAEAAQLDELALAGHRRRALRP
jgi:flagellar FliJ protein